MQQKSKSVKDFYFLTEMKSTKLGPYITKRIEIEGEGEMICELPQPFDFRVSYEKYSQQGYVLNKVHGAKLRMNSSSSDIPNQVMNCIFNMKLKERAWISFNRSDRIPQTETTLWERSEEKEVSGANSDHADKASPLNENENNPEAEAKKDVNSTVCPGDPNKLISTGCHFYITMEEVKFKVGETYISKKMFCEQENAEIQILLSKRKTQDALKKLRDIVNATSGIDRKKINIEEEVKDIFEINAKAKEKYLRILANVKDAEVKSIEEAVVFARELVRDSPTEERLIILSNFLLKNENFPEAFETAKILLHKNAELGAPLIETLKERFGNWYRVES